MLRRLMIAGGPSGDPHQANVVSLLRLSGVEGGTSFVDLTGRVWTRFGNIKTKTDQFAFGDSSTFCDGAGDYITTPHDPLLNIDETDSLTLEFYYRYQGFADRLIAKKPTNTRGFQMAINSVPSVSFTAYTSGGVPRVLGGYSDADNPIATWACVALVYDKPALEWRTYKEGILMSSRSAYGDLEVLTSAPLAIGADPTHGSSNYFGHIQEFRLTKGVARYKSNYTPLYAPFPYTV